MAVIGIFDSGVGGLGVLVALRRQAPAVDLCYLADSANCPYGTRPVAEIQALCDDATALLLAQGARVVVVACNSGTVAAIAWLRARHPGVPFVGTVPAVKPAAADHAGGGRVVVLSTPVTAASDAYRQLKGMFAAGVPVLDVPCPGLAEAVEHHGAGSPDVARALDAALSGHVSRPDDRVVLGCTHYGLVRGDILARLHPGVTLLDTDGPVAAQALRLYGGLGLGPGDGGERYFTSGDPAAAAVTIGRILGRPVRVDAACTARPCKETPCQTA
jgi:glutamate racemase